VFTIALSKEIEVSKAQSVRTMKNVEKAVSQPPVVYPYTKAAIRHITEKIILLRKCDRIGKID
jgi:hypothetical protein